MQGGRHTPDAGSRHPPANPIMELAHVLIASAGVLAVGVTRLLWLRVKRKVHTDEHAVTPAPRANGDPNRIAYPA